jgi:hypothetical protein
MLAATSLREGARGAMGKTPVDPERHALQDETACAWIEGQAAHHDAREVHRRQVAQQRDLVLQRRQRGPQEHREVPRLTARRGAVLRYVVASSTSATITP